MFLRHGAARNACGSPPNHRAPGQSADTFDIVVGPGATVGIAAVLSAETATKDKIIATVATGGHVDQDRFQIFTWTRG